MTPRHRLACTTTLLASLWLGGCSGGASDAETPSGDPAVDDPSSLVGEGEATDGASATIRLVNLWVDEGSGTSIDVTSKPMMGSERPLFEDVGFGELTGTATVPEDVRLSVYRSGEAGSAEEVGSLVLTSGDLQPGRRLTLVVSYHRPFTEGGRSAAIAVFYDTAERVTGGMPVRPVDGAFLVADVGPATRVSGEDHESLTFGTPGDGCLRPAGTDAPGSEAGATTVSLGGTGVLTYDVPPGTTSIAAWGEGHTSCGGTPRVGPIDVEIAAAGRTYVFAYGTGPDDLRLVAVPSSGGS